MQTDNLFNLILASGFCFESRQLIEKCAVAHEQSDNEESE